MPLDPQFETILRQRSIPYPELSPAEARARIRAAIVDPTRVSLSVAHVEDRAIPGPAGALPVRIYTPEGEPPFPVLVYFHGSGFVVCDLDTHDGLCRAMTKGARCLTVSVDYRLAPEHPFPAAVDDCLAATAWASAHATELGGDLRRVAVGGDSAGGCLAAVVARLAHEQGGPPLIYQLLLYPVADRPGASVSYTENAEGYGLTGADMFWFCSQYLPSGEQTDDPRAAPLRAADLSGLPPALVVTAEYDVLRDEGEEYARRLQEAGVPTTLVRYDGMIHGFLEMGATVQRADEALHATTARLRAGFEV